MIASLQKWILNVVLCVVPIFFLAFTQDFFSLNKFALTAIGVLLLILMAGISTIVNKKLQFHSTPFDMIFLAGLGTYVLSILVSSPNKVQALFIMPYGLAAILFTYLMYYFVSQLNLKKHHDDEKTLAIIDILVMSLTFGALVFIIFFFQPFKNVALTSLGFLKNPYFSLFGSYVDTIVAVGFMTAFLWGVLGYGMMKKQSQSPLGMAAALVCTVALCLSLFNLTRLDTLEKRVQAGAIFAPMDISWNAAVETLKNPKTAFFGSGVDNFGAMFTRNKTVDYNKGDLWQLNFSISRSALLHVWAETGLLGLLVALISIVITLKENQILLRKNDEYAGGYMLGGLFLIAALLFLPFNYMGLWISGLYAAMLVQQTAKYKEKQIMKVPVDHIVSQGLVAVMTLLIVGVLGYGLVRFYYSEVLFKQSLDAARVNNGRAVYEKELTAIRVNPYNERFRNQFSQINMLLANNVARKEDLTDDDRKFIAQFIQQAVKESKTLIQLNPQKSGYWGNLALIYRNMIGVAKDAEAWTIAAFRQALVLDPLNPTLRLNLGGVFYTLKDYSSAIQEFKQAALLKPDWANAHYNLAWALFENNQVADAVARMQTVLSLVDKDSPDYKNATENLATFKEKLPKTDPNDKDATQSGQLQVPAGQNSGGVQPPLGLPQEPNASISPQIELPKDTAPVITPAAVPTGQPAQDGDGQQPQPTQSL